MGVYFAEDIQRVLLGVGEGVNLLVAQRGLHDAADAAYVAGYWAALRTVATSFGLSLAGLGYSATLPLPELVKQIREVER